MMNEEIKSILGNSITVDNKEIPVEHLRYKGSSKTYITWTMLDEDPALFGNDEALASVCPVDIDVFSDGNYLNIIKKIKELLKSHNWTWTGDSSEMYEEDTKLNHKTCSFEKERIDV